MNKQQTFLLAMGLGFISGLFFIAGSGGFNILSHRTGNFLGILFAMASGFVWVMYGMKSAQK